MKRVTQRDLARYLGISQVTVSRALAKNPHVSEATRQKILAAAQELGYQPDPVLSSLNAYRRTRQPIEKGQTLAWITGQEEKHSHSFYQGALQKAAEYGYRLELFNPNAKHMTPERVMKILYNRSVSGLIFAPRRNPHTELNIKLDNFCAVGIGYTLQSPIVDRVITDHHHNVMVGFTHLYEAGYRRIGMTTTLNTEKRIEGRRISSFLYQLELYPDVEAIPVARYINEPEAIMKDVTAWIEKYRPDAIICHNPLIFDICDNLGLRVPEDIAVVSITRNERWKNYEICSGIDELYPEVGAMAVDVLVSLIRNNEYGIPSKRRIHMLEGEWNPGKTMRHLPQPTS